jgi:23S rRNA pseudouridine2605 synthase
MENSEGQSGGNRPRRPRIQKTYTKVEPGQPHVRPERNEFQGDPLRDLPDELRLNKYISNSGICARRKADNFIKEGRVTVNGTVITEMGYKVKKNDDIRFDGKQVIPERKVYVLLNKPKDFITTVEDDKSRKTVMDLVRHATRSRIYPVGRLDRNTTGLLLLTNDGELSQNLTHPSSKASKIYRVELNKEVEWEHLKAINEGVELEDGKADVIAAEYSSSGDKRVIGIELHIGKNRIVRRIFEHFEYKVTKLDRVWFAGLTKKNLMRGKWRYLTPKEVVMLRQYAAKNTQVNK